MTTFSCTRIPFLTQRNNRLMRCFAGLALGLAATASVHADNVYYTSPEVNSDWFTGTNWSTGSIPTSADTAVIDDGLSSLLTGGTTTVDKVTLGDTGGTFGTLTVSGSNASLTVNTQIAISLGGNDGSSMVISNGATVYGENTLVGFDGQGNLTVTGQGSTLTTGATSGSLYISTGTVAVTNGGHITSGGSITVDGFGTGAAIVVSGSGSTLASASDFSFKGDGTMDVNNGARVNIGGAAGFGSANGFAITVSGPNSAIIQSGSLSNFYVGDQGQFGGIGSLAVSNSGTVSVGTFGLGTSGSSAVGVATISGTGSTVQAVSVTVGDVGTGTLTISNGGKLTNLGNGQNIIGRTKNTGNGTVLITGTGSVWNAGSNAVTVASGSNTVGRLQIDDGGALNAVGLFVASSTGAVGTVTQTSGTANVGVLTFGRGAGIYHLQGGVLQLGGNGITFSSTGTYTLDLAGGTIQNTSTAFSSTATGTLKAGTVTSYDSNGFAGTWSGTLTGAGGLNKIGAGALTLSGNNNFTGGLTLTSGTISAGSTTALGTGTMTFAGASTLQTVTATRTLTNNMVINNGVTGTIGGTLTLGLSGAISGGGALAKVGTGTLVLTGNNSYSGGTTLTAGVTQFSSTSNFGTGSVNLTGGTLQWGSGNTADMSSRLALGSGGGTIDTNGNSVTFASSATGVGGLTKAGTGTLTLSASNAYTGNTTLTAGTLRIANQNAIVNSSTLVFNGGTLTGNGTAYTLGNAVSLAANSAIAGASSLTLSGNVALGSTNRTLTVTNTGTTFFSGTLAGTAGFTKAGSGVLALTGVGNYTGTTAITAGALSFTAGSLGSGPVSVSGGELRWAAGNTANLANNITLGSIATFNTNGNNASMSGTMSGSGAFVKTGEGVLTLTGPSTATSGSNSVLGGTLRLGANGALASNKELIISSIVNGGTATMDLNGYNLTVSRLTFNGTTAGTTANRTVNNLMTGSGTLTLGGNVFYWFGFGDESTDPQSSTISGNLALGSATRSFQISTSAQATGPELIVDAVVSGAGGINKIGFAGGTYGTMALNAANTYTGTTLITGGILSVKILANGGQASGIGASTSANTNLVINSGTLRYTGTGGSTDRLFVVGDASASGIAGTIESSGSGAIAFTNTGTFSSFANRSATLVLSGTNTGDNTLAGAYVDNFFSSNSVEKDGTGKWILTGSSTYGGGTTLNAGILGLGSALAISGSGVITMNGGTMQYSAANQTDYSARFSTGTSQQYNIDTNGQSVTYASSLTSDGGSLTKLGAGALTLTGSNSYTAGTLVKSGTLVAGNNSAVGTGSVTVDGGVFLVDTNITVSNSVTVNSGTYARSVTGNIAGTVNATSDISGGVDTTTAVLAGTVSNPTTLITSFAATSTATNDFLRRSDVYSFQGTGTDIFTLQLSYTATTPDSYLGWLSGNQWINAIDGNTGNNATLAQQGFLGSFAAFQALYGTDLSLYLGAYGTDTTGGVTSTWAVLNHNSDFAVIPEPGTWALVTVGLSGLLFFRRRSRS